MEQQLVANAIGHLLVGLCGPSNWNDENYHHKLRTNAYRWRSVFGNLSSVNFFGNAFQFSTKSYGGKNKCVCA